MHYTPFGKFCKRTSRYQERSVMPMKMGIHHKPIGQGHSASWIPAYAGMTGV